MLLKLSLKMKSLIEDEQGQDLIEYALVVALIAFAATAGMGTLATNINQLIGCPRVRVKVSQRGAAPSLARMVCALQL
jgi:pilus assembly protein Flp/PilA